MTVGTAIAGAGELVGKGVYCGMPEHVPVPVRDRHAVVVGRPVECAAAAQRLVEARWKVTVVTRERACGCHVRGCRRRTAMELVCATGIEYLEALVLRRIDTGRIEACSASALFVL